MQRELDTVRTQADSDKQRQEDGRRSIETEIAQWKERYNQLNAEKEELKQQLTRNNRSMNENDVS
jgi:chromosome segregation ATPase